MEDLLTLEDDFDEKPNHRADTEAFLADLERFAAAKLDNDTKENPKMPTSKQAQNKKLMELQQKMNEARAKARAAREEERGGKKVNTAAEREARNKEFEERLKSEGYGDPDRYWRLQMTQEAVEEKYKKEKAKRDPAKLDPTGPLAHYRSFLKREKLAAFTREEYEEQKEKKGEDFYAGANSLVLHTDIDPEKVDLMVAELEQQEQRRRNFSRRRRWNEDDDIYFINERNRNYNKKIARAFDAYTADIKENLERGTAL